MNKYYVISPNVENIGNVDYYLDMMFAQKTIMMGWAPTDDKGKMFDNMDIGDYVICAQGANNNKKVFFSGKLISGNTKDWPYTRHLAGFVDLRNEKIEFCKNNAYGEANRIPAIYELKLSNAADKAICETIKQKVDLKIKMEQVDNMKDVLLSNKNLILTGAPGTGKTYTAKKIAEAIGATSLNGRLGFVQFHPSYDYTDFVEGLRPVQGTNGNIGFKRQNGIFMDFCVKALMASRGAGYTEETKEEDIKDKYVFIIDEINRGELSKIFGELFFSIDPGYRGEKGKIITQYHNLWTQKEKNDFFGEEFYIPKNVYIIGTMNDIDRSVESMDFAMRRRFTFKEVTAADSVIILDSVANISQTIKDELKARMIALNEAIGKEETLGTAYQLGGAYFKKIENCLDDNDPFQTLWNNYLSNILKEYLRGMGKTQMTEKMQKFAQAFHAKSEV